MLKLLIATDGSENSLRAVRHVAKLAGQGIAIEAILCNVQPPVLVGEVGAVAPIEIAKLKRTLAMAAAIDAARGPLEAANVRVSVQEMEGDAAEEIAGCANSLRCDGIVMGRRGLGALASLVLGSVSTKVLRLSQVPVTLVK